MKTLHRLPTMGLLAGLLLVYLPPSVRSAETNNPPAASTNAPSADAEETAKALLASLRLQEQLHATLLAIEQSRAEAAAVARTNADALAGRLELIEQSLTAQREREMHAAQSATRAMLIASGVFAGVGLLALLVTVWFQLRGMNRLAEIATGLPPGRALGSSPSAALLSGAEPHPNSADATGARLFDVIERLENRIHELEHVAHLPLAAGEHRPAAPRMVSLASNAANGMRTNGTDQIGLLLGKGQALLNLGQAENALACFDAVLAQEPKHAEAQVKKGAALERLKRLDEALTCYDRALAADPSLTQAHLAKGGVFNQLERFNEALECYEQALKSQPTAVVGQ